MEITLKHYGNGANSPSNIIEMIIKSKDTIIEEDITNRDSFVDDSLIMALRDIADELEENNRLLTQQK